MTHLLQHTLMRGPLVRHYLPSLIPKGLDGQLSAGYGNKDSDRDNPQG